MDASRRLRLIAFNLVFILFAVHTSSLISETFGSLRFKPLFTVSGISGMLLGALVGDFFYYWMHRAQHGIPFLWRFHAVHHSVEKMGTGAGYHHVSQPLIEAFALAVPVSVFVGVREAGLLSIILTIQGVYLHSVSKLHFGPLSRLLVDNRVHRIHHSSDPAHFNTNYGVFTTLWDQLFGTMRFPARDEWPATGLVELREPATLSEYLLAARGRPSDRPADDARVI